MFASYLLKSVKHNLKQKMLKAFEISFGHYDQTGLKKFGRLVIAKKIRSMTDK